jgi:two-component system, OmpR family, sensor histidine kinase TctE
MPERLALSLRSRLLLGLLLPLLLLIGANAWFAYDRAVQAANEAYDRSLYLAARTLAEDLQWQEERLTLQMRPGTGYLFENHTGSRLFYQVSDGQGRALLGAQDLPAPGPNVERVHFFALVEFADTRYNDVPVRLARLTHVLPISGAESSVLHVTVAETREAREALIQTILRETLGSQALLLVAAAVFVSLAVRRAVRPLHQLRDLIEAKADDDLRSLPDRAWPPELQPLVGAINGYTQRLGRLIGIRKRFLDNAAHQLRTPLTALKTQLGLMQRQSTAPHDPALLQAAQRTTDDAVRLTAQLLSLTRAEHGPDMDKRAEVELVALARQVTEDHLWRSHERGDDLGFEALSSRVLVHGNALLLQEALANLIDNAMHHGGRGVHITVRVGPQSLEVEDNGPGIAPEHQAHVFERFYRAAAAGVSGSGLGLAIVQEIARQHGAQVQVHSPVRDGRGTRIRLYWSA